MMPSNHYEAPIIELGDSLAPIELGTPILQSG
jgi:hypothetical protein